MVEQNSKVRARASGGDGHLALDLHGLDKPNLAFSFEQRQSGVGFGSALGAHLLFAIIAILIYTYAPTPSVSGPIANNVPSGIVWLATPDPVAAVAVAAIRCPSRRRRQKCRRRTRSACRW